MTRIERAETASDGRAGERGFSLVEAAVVAAMFGLIMAVAVSALSAGNKTLSQSVSRTVVDDAAAKLVQEIVLDVRQSGPSSSDEDDDDDDDSDLNVQAGAVGQDSGTGFPVLRFRRPGAWDATAKRSDWGGFVTWRWQLAAAGVAGYRGAEVQNGRDDNGNGLVDEGYVTRQEGSGTPFVKATNVLRLSLPRFTEADGADNDLDGLVDEPGEGNGLDDNANGVRDELGDQWSTVAASSSPAQLVTSSGTILSHGTRFERGTSPRDDQLTITVTVAGRLEDSSIYVRQITETVLLRN